MKCSDFPCSICYICFSFFLVFSLIALFLSCTQVFFFIHAGFVIYTYRFHAVFGGTNHGRTRQASVILICQMIFTFNSISNIKKTG